MDQALQTLRKAILEGNATATDGKLLRLRKSIGHIVDVDEPDGEELWVHLIVIEDDDGNLKQMLPLHSRGPHYNSRSYGRSLIPKGQRAYRNKSDIHSAIKRGALNPGCIVYDSEDLIVWKYPYPAKEIKEIRASVFIRQFINAPIRTEFLI